MSVKQAIALSNEAVAMMDTANYGGAVERLTEGIRIYRRADHDYTVS